jgi:VWFA-related protein
MLWLGATTIGLAVAALLGAQQMPTIRVPVRVVTVPTLVFSGESQLISGLQKADFRVLDNGRLQTTLLDTTSAPVSVVIAVQVNQEVRSYAPFIAKAGSVVETLLVGETGEAAVIAYNGDVSVAKPFCEGDVQSTLRKLSPAGRPARMIDAGVRAIALLKERPVARARILLFIGQPMDSGSESSLDSLREQAERENVAIHALTLPVFGKAFVSDTFSLQGVSSGERGGFRAGVDLRGLIGVLGRSGAAEKGADPFSALTAATGGTQIHFRKQPELEGAIAAMGVQLRSSYLLSYYPSSTEAGYHTIHVDVNVPGAKAWSRPGYWRGATE